MASSFKDCFVLLFEPTSDKDQTDRRYTSVIYPALSHFEDFRTFIQVLPEKLESVDDPAEVRKRLITADLVILDRSYEHGAYWRGVRYAVDLPIVDVYSARFTPESSKLEIEQLKQQITQTLAAYAVRDDLPNIRGAGQNHTATYITADLAARVDDIATTLEDMRINSAHAIIIELRKIASELQLLHNNEEGISELARATTIRLLRILSTFFDEVGSRKGVRIVISGAVAGLLGGGGWPAASVFALSSAAWHGPDMFKFALSKAFPQPTITSKGASISQKSRQRSSRGAPTALKRKSNAVIPLDV